MCIKNSHTVCYIFLILSTCCLPESYGQIRNIRANYDVLESARIVNVYEANTQEIEFSPTIYGNGLVYVSTENTDSGPNADSDPDLNTNFFRLYYLDLSENFNHPQLFSAGLGNGYHMGPCAFSSDQQMMYFSQTNAKKKDAQGKYQMGLQLASWSGGNWKIYEGFEYNDPDYSIVHPTISDDGTILIFASNKTGGYGKVDLYLCKKNESGWTSPKNLGPFINSEENDMFPFLYKNEWLFFASNGKEGHGGLDLYVSRLIHGSWSYPQNLGQPVNSESDDFGFILADVPTTAYFSSSRKGGQGKDDIYRADFSRSVFDTIAISSGADKKIEDIRFTIKIIDKSTYLPLSDALIRVSPIARTEQSGGPIGYQIDTIEEDTNSGDLILKMKPHLGSDRNHINKITDKEGLVNLTVRNNNDYLIHISKPGFIDEQTILDASVIIPELFFLLSPVPDRDDIVIPTKKGDVIVFDHLYYGFDEAKIEPGAAIELDALAAVMKKNPTMKIELSAHTDSRGRKSYNLNLSQKRADAAKSYLMDLGISKDRVVAVGYGESLLRNHCSDGLSCSEIEHAYNRRTEVKILEE